MFRIQEIFEIRAKTSIVIVYRLHAGRVSVLFHYFVSLYSICVSIGTPSAINAHNIKFVYVVSEH